MNELTIRRPDDMHVHFRLGPMLQNVVPATANQFARALVMPNTDPPVLNGYSVRCYRQEINDAVEASFPPEKSFEPLMTFKITPQTTGDDVISAKAVGAVAGKLYPDGVTTNSTGGVRDFKALHPIFNEMSGQNLVLCLHGEHPDAECMDRERRFVDEVFNELSYKFPKLRIVLEHISTEIGVEAVRRISSPLVAGTITAHHLELTHTDVFGGLLKPHLFCKPIAKWERDRDALLDAAMSGQPQFFFGSDSAPHLREMKECAEGCAGVFSAPVLMPLLAGIFDSNNALDKLEDFTSRFGAEFYGLPLNDGTITLVREECQVPQSYCGIVPYRAGEILPWRVTP